MSFADLGYDVAFGTATITIDRPERRNALRTRTVTEMIEALERADRDDQVGVIVITGAGDVFCAGGDLEQAPGLERAVADDEMRFVALKLVLAVRALTKPVIAKVRGYCIGMGNELNLLCDVTVAGESARFGQAGPKVGSAPLIGGAQLLPLVCGLKRAREILLFCRHYSGDEAVRMGLANRVVADTDLDAEVEGWCEELLELSPQSLRLAKLALAAPFDTLWSSVLHGVELSGWFGRSGDLLEGAAAFLDKRPPQFRPGVPRR
jgi:1,4-dihydroxy-2-naphthoyl-CoA synthase